MTHVEDELIQVAPFDRASKTMAPTVRDIGDAFTTLTEVAGGLDALVRDVTSAPRLRPDREAGSQPDVMEHRPAGDSQIESFGSSMELGLQLVQALDQIAAAVLGGAIDVLDKAGISGPDLMEPGPRFTKEHEPATSNVMGAIQGAVLDDLLTSPASPANGLPSALRAVTDPKAHEPSAAHGDPNDVLQDMQPIASGPSRGAVGNAADATGPQVRRGRGGKAMQQIMDGIMELVEVHTAANGRSAYVNGILPTR